MTLKLYGSLNYKSFSLSLFHQFLITFSRLSHICEYIDTCVKPLSIYIEVQNWIRDYRKEEMAIATKGISTRQFHLFNLENFYFFIFTFFSLIFQSYWQQQRQKMHPKKWIKIKSSLSSYNHWQFTTETEFVVSYEPKYEQIIIKIIYMCGI
jgi:hypothetical protein